MNCDGLAAHAHKYNAQVVGACHCGRTAGMRRGEKHEGLACETKNKVLITWKEALSDSDEVNSPCGFCGTRCII